MAFEREYLFEKNLQGPLAMLKQARDLRSRAPGDGERSRPRVPASSRSELVTALAGMVMACNEEVRP